MIDVFNLNSADAVSRYEREKEKARLKEEQKESVRLEAVAQQNKALLESNRLLEEQLKLAKEESKQGAIELKKSKRMNWAMFAISVLSILIAIASLVVAIIK